MDEPIITADDRDLLIRNLIQKKKKDAYEKAFAQTVEINQKILKVQENPKVVPNAYESVNPATCPDIARGEEYVKSLDPAVQSIIQHYTGSDSSQINNTLRLKMNTKMESTHLGGSVYTALTLLDKAFAGAPPLESAITVYRGVRNIALKDDLGYSSCSLRKQVSDGFGGGDCYTIILPAGSRVLFICPLSRCLNEAEILIDRSGSFKSIGHKKLVYENGLY